MIELIFGDVKPTLWQRARPKVAAAVLGIFAVPWAFMAGLCLYKVIPEGQTLKEIVITGMLLIALLVVISITKWAARWSK